MPAASCTAGGYPESGAPVHAVEIAPDEETRAECEAAHLKKAKLLQKQEAEYDFFCKKNDLKKQWDRLHVAQYGPKQATAAERVAEQDYQVWSKELNFNDSVKTLANYYEVKYTDSPRFQLLGQYVRDVKDGWVSPLSGFANYERLYNRVQTEIVGQTTSTGLLITGQSDHFIQRVIGTMVDPKWLKNELKVVRRSGVEFEEILQAVRKGAARPIRYTGGRPSQVFQTDACVVSINPDTGVLIQCNPKGD